MDSKQLKTITDRFGIRVQRYQHAANGVYRLELANGKHFALKPMTYPRSQIRWMDRTLQTVRQAGFTRLAWRNPYEPEGKALYVQLPHGKPYVLSPWVWGRWPAPESMQDMRTCGALLAEFHQYGALSPRSLTRSNMIGRWPKELRLKHAKLKRQVLLARQSRRSDPINLFLREYGDELLGYSRKALTLLRDSQYQQACREAKQRPHICHGDGGPTNFIFSQDGPYLIDFETMRVDLRAYDLYRVIFNSCWTSGWNFATAMAILDGYQEVAKLNSTDMQLIIAWLRFPRTSALRLQHYQSRYHGTRASIAAKLPDAIRAERRVTTFLAQLGSYLT